MTGKGSITGGGKSLQADSWFSHISVEVPGTETSNEWLEPVADAYYDRLKDKG
jgi:hypothetical protein